MSKEVEPVLPIEVAIQPKTMADQQKLNIALTRLTQENTLFGVSTDTESGQMILRGTDEFQLDAKIDALKHVYGIDLTVGAPQAAYRETLSRPATIKYTHKRQLGGSGQFAEVTIEFEPLPPGSGFVFENAVPDGSIPMEFIPSVEKGLAAQKENGLLAGFPVTDFMARLVAGKYHEVDSNALIFDIAARAAFRELFSKNVVKLLEPIMKVEIVTPEDFLGGVMGDLNVRRGQVLGTETRGNAQAIVAIVPLASMFHYHNSLKAMTQGRGNCTMKFDHYEEVPIRDDDPRFPGAAAMRVA